MTSLPRPLAVYALTREGARLARRLASDLPGAELFLPERLAQGGEPSFERFGAALAENFHRYRGHVIFAAAGIVVRSLDGLLRGKAVDPAVVVLDARGRHAVSLLSGHLGGANDLARETARLLGGQAVITTATDSLGLPSLEVIAAARGCRVENLPALKGISGDILDGRAAAVYDPAGWLRPELERWGGCFNFLVDEPDPRREERPLVWVGWRTLAPPRSWLVLRPPCLALGMGCNRGTGADEMEDFVRLVLRRAGLSAASLKCLATVEAKRDELGLAELARRLDLEMVFYEPRQLNQAAVPNPSAMVEKHMGTSSVCEAAAILAAGNGRLLATKQKSPNATAAVALASPEAGSP